MVHRRRLTRRLSEDVSFVVTPRSKDVPLRRPHALILIHYILVDVPE